jgi:hypothetical protein
MKRLYEASARRSEGTGLSWKAPKISFMCDISILFYNDFIKWFRNSEISLIEMITYPFLVQKLSYDQNFKNIILEKKYTLR